jgi:peptidoglycan/LPS O-acetylase OafA/YrhL
MIPYFLVSILVISFKMIAERYLYVENPASWTAFVDMFYLPSAGYFLWFVYTLFLIFLIIPFFHSSKHLYLLFAATLVWLLIPVQVTDWFCLAQWKDHFFYFVAGCVASREKWIRWLAGKISPLPVLVVCAGIYGMIFGLFGYHPEGLVLATVRLWLALVGIAFILCLSRMTAAKDTPVRRFLVWLSATSYTIYLFHTMFEGFAKALLFRMTTASNVSLPFVAGAIFVILAGVAGPVILHRLSVKLKNKRNR